MDKMKAIIATKYGPPNVLELRDVDKPIPKDNEILIKIRATTVSSGDYRIRKADPFIVRLIFGFSKPRREILGGIFAGEIEKVGNEITKFKIGDKVFGSSGMKFGTYAEYLTLTDQSVVTKMPRNASFEEAAALPFGFLTAISFLQKANISKGQDVLIYGASGSVGSSAIQYAKFIGAIVTGVSSTKNIELVKSLGANKTIDYTKEDLSKINDNFDIFYETVGKTKISWGKKLLKNKGIYIGGSSGLFYGFAQLLLTKFTSSKKVITGVSSESTENLILIKNLFEENKIKAVIDKTYKLEEIPAAHEYAEKGHKKGNIVITV